MYNNKQTFIISVCILQSHLFTVLQDHVSLLLEKTVLGMLVQVLWYHSPHLMFLACSLTVLLAYANAKMGVRIDATRSLTFPQKWLDCFSLGISKV